MKQYRTLAAIGFILFLSWTLFICHAVSQVKFTQLERSSIKWTIPVAKRVVPGIPDFVMTYMTLANLIDSTEIELGTKIDSMKWSTGDTLKLYTSDGVFKTKITFAGMGTVTDVTGTSPIIITGTSTVTPNVTIQNATTSQSGALTSTDWNTFNGKVGGSGTSTRVAFWSGTSTLSSNANLYWDNTNSRLGIGTSSPSKQLTTTQDVSVNGLDIGLGLGNVIINVRVGSNALNNNTTGSGNIAIGSQSLFTNTTGSNNVSNGYQSLYYNTTGSNNVALGAQSLLFNTTGGSNIASGSQALFNNTTGSNNVALGFSSLFSNSTGNNNLGNGAQSLYYNTTGSNNVANGYWSLLFNTTGSNNVADGMTSMQTNTTGSNNVALGFSSLFSNSTGNNNVALGLYAGYSETGSNKLYIENSTSSTPLIGGDFATDRVGINTAIGSIARTLHVTGEARITDLTTDTPTGLVGADADGDLGSVGLSGLSMVSGVLTNSNTGTVTSVGISGSDFNITGSPVTTSGNIGLEIASGVVGPTELASTAVTAGSYTNTNITVDADGRITSAANGTAGVTTLAAIGATANANGATISGSTLNLQPASASFGGVVTTGSQTFAGSKTFDYLGGTEGTNLTTGTSLIMATNAGKLENLYGTVAGYDLPLYNPTGNNWELTKLKTVNGNSLLGSGNVALTTDLSFTGASSPYTLNSNTGNDVTFAAGSGVTLSRSGDQLTIAASGMTSWNLAASGTAGSASITNGSTATITAGSGITATRSGNNITISSAAAGGEQFWTTTTNATSHEIILKDHAGTTNVSALKLIEGAGIELTTSAGTFSNSNLTITNTGDLLTTNEGYLGVGAGGATSSTLQGYNSSGTATGSGMTFNAGQGLLISETTSTNGGQITYTLNQHNTQMEVVSDITSATYDGTYRKVNFTQDIPGTGFTFSAANDEITVSTTGVYEISYGASYEIQNGASNVTEWTVYIGGSSSYNSKSFQTDVGSANPNAISKTFLVTLAAGNTVSLRYTRSAGTGTLIDIFSPVISISRLN